MSLTMSIADELERLQALRDNGALTEEEYVRAKARVLDHDNAASDSVVPGALQQLRRSQSDRMVGGVCGGLGSYTTTPAWVWRVLFCLSVICFGFGVLLYCLMWLFIPLEHTGI